MNLLFWFALGFVAIGVASVAWFLTRQSHVDDYGPVVMAIASGAVCVALAFVFALAGALAVAAR